MGETREEAQAELTSEDFQSQYPNLDPFLGDGRRARTEKRTSGKQHLLVK